MRADFYDLPPDLPVPVDDGACAHLVGLALPALRLSSTGGRLVDLHAAAAERAVLFFYPRTGRPDEPAPIGWDAIPGARGCTPQSCGFRDLHAGLQARGAAIFGVSTQTTAFQQEVVARLHLPYVLLSDADFALTDALRLPTFTFAGMRLLRRMAWVCEDARIVKVFYPVFPPNESAATVMHWLDAR